MSTDSESLLLDTHIWLWLVSGERGAASDEAWNIIRSSVREGRAAISDITFWELAMKGSKHKMGFEPDTRSFLLEAKQAAKISVIEINRNLLIDGALLDAHPDPADRLIIATARKYNIRLATADRRIISWAKKNPGVKVLNVRSNVK